MLIDFICNLELLVEQSKLKLNKKFRDDEIAIKEGKRKKFDQVNERCKSYSSTKFD